MARVTGLEPTELHPRVSRVSSAPAEGADEARDLGDAPRTVNKAFAIFLIFADVCQSPMLEEKSGDVGRTGCRKDLLDND